MIYNVYSVFDKKVGAYLQPFFLLSHEQAVRSFLNVLRDGESLISKSPSDFELYCVSVFDDANASFLSQKSDFIMGGSDYASMVNHIEVDNSVKVSEST